MPHAALCPDNIVVPLLAAGGMRLEPPPRAENPQSEDATVPALVQHFEAVAIPRQQGSAATAAPPADRVSHTSQMSSDTALAARAERLSAIIRGPSLADTSAAVHRRWTQSRENAPSVSRAATRDSVYGPTAGTAAPYRNRTGAHADSAEQATQEPVPAGSGERAAVPDTPAVLTMRDAKPWASRAPPDIGECLMVPSASGWGQPDSARKATVPGSLDAARTAEAQAAVRTFDRLVAQLDPAGASGEQDTARARAERTVRFCSGLADDGDGSSGGHVLLPHAAMDAVSAGPPGVRPAVEVSTEPLQAMLGGRPEAQVR